MLNLASTSSQGWLRAAVAELDTVLLDHAHCEKKAASTAINLIFRYTHWPVLVRPLSELAREELEHFELVLGLLERRGVSFERLRPSAYAGKLIKAARTEEPERLMDTLLCCSLIEARSCERMKLLATGLEEVPHEAEVAEMYRSLLACEARHHMLYVDLASELFGHDQCRDRLAELAQHEAGLFGRYDQSDPDWAPAADRPEGHKGRGWIQAPPIRLHS